VRTDPKGPLSTYSFGPAGGRGQQGHATRAASAAERASAARARRRRGHLRRRAATHAHHFAVAAAAWPAAALVVLISPSAQPRGIHDMNLTLPSPCPCPCILCLYPVYPVSQSMSGYMDMDIRYGSVVSLSQPRSLIPRGAGVLNSSCGHPPQVVL